MRKEILNRSPYSRAFYVARHLDDDDAIYVILLQFAFAHECLCQVLLFKEDFDQVLATQYNNAVRQFGFSPFREPLALKDLY